MQSKLEKSIDQLFCKHKGLTTYLQDGEFISKICRKCKATIESRSECENECGRYATCFKFLRGRAIRFCSTCAND